MMIDIKYFFEKIKKLNPVGYSFDSRLVKPNEVFFAIRGEKVDGNDYAMEAIHKGALAAFVDKKEISDEKKNIFYVENVTLFLQQMAKYKIAKVKPTIIGITGSVGKTTTKEFIYQLLSPFISIVKPVGSFNSQITLPITILNFPESSSFYLLEMGVSQVGEMDKLINIAPPDIGVITNISHSHVEYFGSKEAIAREKTKILLPSTKLKLVHISVKEYLDQGDCTTYGLKGSSADNTSVDIEYEVKDNQVRLFIEEEVTDWITLPFTFAHFIQNAVAAIIIARYLGLSFKQIEQQALLLQSYHHRCKIINKKEIIFFDDCYNASEVSFKAAIDSLPKPAPGHQTIAIIGSVKEQGSFAFTAHQQIGNYALAKIDTVFCKGEETLPIVEMFKKNNKPAYYFEDKQDILAKLKAIAQPGDVVLVKGSKSHQLWEIIEQF
ncbi:MAG: UDP-N-acetylmuramoyl-tripeptide--D-alanyl-D-alanine ligase [Chlamydiales bacterium]|nr:UDP-N-acetylmuramoyl-tripeptide--D-alanyl-D-alanine ligase [Chlamydiales bacterium]